MLADFNYTEMYSAVLMRTGPVLLVLCAGWAGTLFPKMQCCLNMTLSLPLMSSLILRTSQRYVLVCMCDIMLSEVSCECQALPVKVSRLLARVMHSNARVYA